MCGSVGDFVTKYCNCLYGQFWNYNSLFPLSSSFFFAAPPNIYTRVVCLLSCSPSSSPLTACCYYAVCTLFIMQPEIGLALVCNAHSFWACSKILIVSCHCALLALQPPCPLQKRVHVHTLSHWSPVPCHRVCWRRYRYPRVPARGSGQSVPWLTFLGGSTRYEAHANSFPSSFPTKQHHPDRVKDRHQEGWCNCFTDMFGWNISQSVGFRFLLLLSVSYTKYYLSWCYS